MSSTEWLERALAELRRYGEMDAEKHDWTYE